MRRLSLSSLTSFSSLVSPIYFLAVFFFYLVFIAPGLLPADSGEFQVVAAVLGVAHPPGFPLYTLLGKLFITLIPIGDPAYRLNLLSALLAALTLLVVARTVRLLTGSWPASLIAATALGVSTTFWSQATTANVRMLTALCAALALYCLARLRANHQSPSSTRRSYILLALSLGLGISHHASLAFMAVVFIVYGLLLRWLPKRPSPPGPLSRREENRRERGGGVGVDAGAVPDSRENAKWMLWTFIAFAVPFLFTLYLPIRGVAGAFLAPPHLATLPGYLEHVLATGFEGDFFYYAHWQDLPDRLAILGNILTFQFNPVLLIGMAFGSLMALRRDWKLFVLLAGSFAVHSFVAVTYRAPQTVEYMLPAYVVMVVALGYGLEAISEYAIRNANYVLRVACCVLWVAFPLAALALLVRNLPSYVILARDNSTREYAEGVLTAAPPGALVLAAWHWAAPMWYLQQVEGARPDVEVQYVFPQGESLAVNWVERIVAGAATRPVIVTSFYPFEYERTGFRFIPLGPAWLATGTLTEMPYPLTEANALFGERWRLAGFKVEAAEVQPGETVAVVAAWRTPLMPEDINFFVQAIGPDGALYGQMDVSHRAARSVQDELLIHRYTLTLRPDAPPGDYALVAGAYLPDGARLLLGDGPDDSYRLATIRVAPATLLPVTRNPIFRPFAAPALIGFDYDHTLPDSVRLYLHWRLGGVPEIATVWMGGSPYAELSLPAGPGFLTTTVDLPIYVSQVQVVVGSPRVPWPLDLNSYTLRGPTANDRYVPLGGAMVLVGARYTRVSDNEVQADLSLLATRPLVEDDIVKVDLIGPDYAWVSQSDSVPAGGALPTLKWVRGSLIHDRHRLEVPAGATGPARLELAVYDHLTNRVLPILDPRLALQGSTVPLGSVEVSP